MERRLVKVKVVELDGRKVFLNFRESSASSAAGRYSVEIYFDSRDRAVLDGPSLASVEQAADVCLQATWASRRILASEQAPSG